MAWRRAARNEKTDYAAGTSSVEFTMASDHKTWAAVTVYDSKETFEKEKHDIESGDGLRGQSCYFSPSERAMVTVLGVPSDEDRGRIQSEIMLGSSRRGR